MSHLALRCLGSFQATLDDQPITGFESRKVRALLAYLAIEADEPHSRDELIGLLWPDRPEAAARASLRQAVANLRDLVGDRAADPPFLIITGDTVQFNRHSNYWLDVAAFDEQLRFCAVHTHRRLETCSTCAERLRAGTELYRGDFLTRFYQSGEEFEEWALLVRERLHRAALNALRLLAEYHDRRAEYPEAQYYALQQIELDPWREEAYRQAMRALALSGQRSAALAQFDKCRRILAAELNVEPAPATKDLAEQIKSGSLTASIDAPSLPVVSTPLIDRERELAELNRLVLDAGCRVITLVGLGGVGKTQLAVSAAASQKTAFVDGVRYIALETLASAGALAPTLARALGLAPGETVDPLSAVANYLMRREMLIVLDNFEQLLPDGAETLAVIVAQAPLVTFIVTSRERLNFSGERVIDVHGLSVPADGQAVDLASYGAIQLFVSRAERVRGSTVLSAEDWRHIAQICRLLSGLPLALELAASWSYQRSFAEIAFELERSLDSIAAPLHDLPQRHRSLKAVFDQSWRLLSEVEREAIQALAVFRGGFDLTAAERVAEVTPATLFALRDKSLLQHAANGRFVVHELIRQYAEEQRRSVNAVDRVCERHSVYYRELSLLAEVHLMGVDFVQWMSRLEADLDNLRFALQWSIVAQPETALEIAAGLWRHWRWRGPLTEGRWWLEQALNATENGERGRARAKALAAASYLSWLQGDFVTARTWAEQSISLWQVQTDRKGLARALIVLGIAAGSLGDHAAAVSALEESISLCRTRDDSWGLAMALFHLADEDDRSHTTAKALLNESLAIFKSWGDRGGVVLATFGLGMWACRTGDCAEAHQQLERALLKCRELNDRWLMARILGCLGEVARSENQMPQAERFFAESLALYREMGARGHEALLLHAIGHVLLQQDQAQRATELFAESLGIFRQLDNQRGVAACLDGLADARAAHGEYTDAVLLFGLANRLRTSCSTLVPSVDRYTPDHYLSVAQSNLDAAQFSEAWAAGHAMSVEAISWAVPAR